MKLLYLVPETDRLATRKLSHWSPVSLLCVCLAMFGCGMTGESLEDKPPAPKRSSGGTKARSGARDGNSAETRIVFFGDSITNAGTRPEGYVSLATQALRDLYPGRDIEVIASGVAGDTVAELQARLERDVISRDPTHVVIFIGVNEVGQRRSAWQIPDEDRRAYRNGLINIVSRIKDSGARPLLCTPAVFGDDPDRGTNENRLIEGYAAISRQVAAETGARLCDLRAAFVEFLRAHNKNRRYEGVLTVDGVHLNEEGNRLVSEQMLRVLDLSDATPAPRPSP